MRAPEETTVKTAPALVAAAFAAALAAAASGVAAQPAPTPASVEAHVAAARQAAGSDLGALLSLCTPPPAVTRTPAESDRYLAAQIALPAPPPGQAFDNLF